MRQARLPRVVAPKVSPGVLPGTGGQDALAPPHRRRDGSWSIEDAEAALRSLTGVLAARVVGAPGGRVQEVHLLTSADVPPKKTVRRVEAAFLKHFAMRIDHRKVSVARSRWPVGYRDKKANSSASFLREPTYPVVDRPSLPPAEPGAHLSFEGHTIELDQAGQMRVQVTLEAHGRRFTGKAAGSPRARSRMTMLASATLRAVEAAVHLGGSGAASSGSIVLDDVDVVDAFQKDFVIASVCSVGGIASITHAGAAPVEESLDRAVILSTLQAAESWTRDRLKGHERTTLT